jgi:hypothetical protein
VIGQQSPAGIHGRVFLEALSISGSVLARWRERPFTGWVHTTFERACNLTTVSGDLAAVVLPSVGDGPLNLVVEGEPAHLAVLEPGMPARLEGHWLRIGRLVVTLDRATLWKPRPDWVGLRSRHGKIQTHLARLWFLARAHAPGGSLLELEDFDWMAERAVGAEVLHSTPDETLQPAVMAIDTAFAQASARQVILTRAREAAETLRAGWDGDRTRLQAAAARLAGLGGGLTPAGDDFLGGVMLWAWLAHPDPESFCTLLLEAAVPGTTMLSAAFLRTAAEGECGAPWHWLLEILASGTEEQLKVAVQDVLAQGHTSGADTLAGFI